MTVRPKPHGTVVSPSPTHLYKDLTYLINRLAPPRLRVRRRLVAVSLGWELQKHSGMKWHGKTR